MGLGDVRRALRSAGDGDALHERVTRLAEETARLEAVLEGLSLRLASLDERLAALEASPRRRRRWLGGG